LVNKILHYGPFPDEKDGGQVVNFYLWRKYYEMFPLVEQYAVPKNVEELNPEAMPYISFFRGGKQLYPTTMMEFMRKFRIPIIEAFHIAENICPHIQPIHDIGGKIILHQTVHWESDRVFQGKLLPEIDWFVAPTRYAKEMITVHAKVNADRISVIPHGVDTNKFYPHESLLRREWGLEGRPVILYCGRIDSWKGLEQLYFTFTPLIRDYDAVIIVRGNTFKGVPKSEKLDYLLTTRANKDPKHLIYLRDWQPPDFIEELMNVCDIYVSPSGHEGFNVPLVEAMSCGKPIVTTKLANHSEILEGTGNRLLTPKVKVGVCDGVQDILVPNADNILGNLVMLIENPAERQELGTQGRNKALQEYNLDKIAVEWHKLFEGLVNKDYDMDKEEARRLLGL